MPRTVETPFDELGSLSCPFELVREPKKLRAQQFKARTMENRMQRHKEELKGRASGLRSVGCLLLAPNDHRALPKLNPAQPRRAGCSDEIQKTSSQAAGNSSLSAPGVPMAQLATL